MRETIEHLQNKEYIGDGVYAGFDGYHVVLWTERDGGRETIFLDASVLESFAELRRAIESGSLTVAKNDRPFLHVYVAKNGAPPLDRLGRYHGSRAKTCRCRYVGRGPNDRRHHDETMHGKKPNPWLRRSPAIEDRGDALFDALLKIEAMKAAGAEALRLARHYPVLSNQHRSDPLK